MRSQEIQFYDHSRSSVLPEHMIEAALKSGRLKLVIPNGRELVNQITLARRLERPVTACEKEFVEFYKHFARTRGH